VFNCLEEAMPTTRDEILSARSVHKTYRLGRVGVPVLRGVDLDVGRGSWVAVLGASGSGKSTLLHLLGGLDRPDSPRQATAVCRRCGRPRPDPASRDACPECGERPRTVAPPQILYEGRELAAMSTPELDRYRSAEVGFVFQFYHLLPELSVLENVTIGAMVRHGRFGYMKARGQARDRARELLDSFGLAHRLRHRPRELSGGERQRVAIARALINRPRVLLADEPTGNRDRATGASILDAIESIRRAEGLTMVMVTHDPTIADRAERTVHLVDGVVAQSPLAPVSNR
jgi:lipoprotein-releasing system ATP-binding protein